MALLRYGRIFFLIMALVFSGCKANNGLLNKKHHKKYKKLKKGEPIPCPMKDC